MKFPGEMNQRGADNYRIALGLARQFDLTALYQYSSANYAQVKLLYLQTRKDLY